MRLAPSKIAPSLVFQTASFQTGVMPEGANTYISKLAPMWRKNNVIETSRNRPGSLVTSVANPLLTDNPKSGRNWLFPKTQHVTMETIHEAHKAESLLAQATDKYTDLINKEGYELRCSDTEPADFIESRLYWISCAVKEPFQKLIKEASHSYVKFGNMMLVKSRVPKKTPTLRIGGRTIQTATSLHGKPKLLPIGGYFLADPLTMFPVYSQQTGRHIGWEQKIANGKPKPFTLEEVIHLPYKPHPGKVLGTSIYEPVLDDIRALRDIEEYVTKLMFKHLFPLVHHEIPSMGEDNMATDDQIREAVLNYTNMAPDGMLFTPPGHKINVVETKGGSLDSSNYLKHLLQRVLMGIGMSEAIMGLGSAAVGMSDMLTAQMHDRVKSFQQNIEWTIDLHIITELLLEAGFDPIRNKKHRVNFVFNEIELETVIRMENHAAQMFEQGIWTEDETRIFMKRNPLTTAERKKKYIYTDKIPVIEAQIEAETAGQIEVLTHNTNETIRSAQQDHENSKDLANHQHGLAKDAASHDATLGRRADANKASLTSTGKPAPAEKPPTAALRAPKLARKAANLNLNPTKSKSGGSAGAAGKNKDNPANQTGSRGAPRFSRSPAAGASSKKTPQSAKNSSLDTVSEFVLEHK